MHLRRIQGERKGIPFGFPPPLTGKCSFKVYSKTKSLNQLDVGFYDYQDIGIAVDEKARIKQLNETKRSILFEMEITEKEAFEICKQNGLLSPHYEMDKRDGCSLCPNANEQRRKQWFSDYPQAYELVLELQEFVKNELPGQYPLRNKMWFI